MRSADQHLDETDERAVFQRRSSINRTPPKGHTNADGLLMIMRKGKDSPAEKLDLDEEKSQEDTEGNEWGDEELSTSPIYRLQAGGSGKALEREQSQRTKRKRIESPQAADCSEGLYASLPSNPRERNNGMLEMTKAIEKLTRKTQELSKLVRESTKTKLEIKRVVREVDHMMVIVGQKWERFKERDSCWKKDVSSMSTPTELEDPQKKTDIKIAKVTIGTQTSWEEEEQENAKGEMAIRDNIRRIMSEDKSFQNLSKVIDEPWPSDMFAHTKVVHMSPANLISEGNVAILIDPRKVETNKTLENLSMRYPAVLDMVRRNEGQIDYLTSTTATKRRDRETEEKTTTVFVLPLQINKDGINDMQEVYKLLTELKDTYGRHLAGGMNLMVSEGLDQQYTRKICEYALGCDQVNTTLIVTKTEQMPKEANSRRLATEKMIVKNNSTTYADLLKTVKDKVDLTKVGVQVKTIKKTREGDLLLEVRGDRQKADALREAINIKTGNKVSLINNETIIHVLDIDAALTKEEVERTIRDSLDSRGAQTIRVTSMRPSRDGNQIATVRTSRATGSILMKKGRIKIGWVGCRIRERVEVVRCFKCLEFGHRRKDCNGEDRSGLCLNCNQTGHQAKDCTSEQFCPSCREGGHRADSTKCQKFRELLKIRGIVKNQARRPIISQDG